MTKHIIPAVIAVLVLGIGMAYHLKLTGTGEGDEKLAAFTKAVVENVPKSFGNWESEEAPLSPEEFKLTNCTGYVSRVYKNKSTGDEISVYVVTGTARHITIHTPQWCYRAAGFVQNGAAQPYEVALPEANAPVSFTTASFQKDTEQGKQQLRIFWSFTDDGHWESPNDAKMYYAWRGAMFKVYLISPETRALESLEQSPNVAFAKEFMPVLNEALFRAAGTAPSPDGEKTASTSG